MDSDTRETVAWLGGCLTVLVGGLIVFVTVILASMGLPWPWALVAAGAFGAVILVGALFSALLFALKFIVGLALLPFRALRWTLGRG